MRCRLGEADEDETVHLGRLAIFVLLQDEPVNSHVLDDLLLLGLGQAKLFKVEALLDCLLAALSSLLLGLFSCLLGLLLLFSSLLLCFLLILMLLQSALTPLRISIAVDLGRRRVLDAEGNAQELHDPGQELPRGERLAFFDLVELIFTETDHARSLLVLGDVVRKLRGHAEDVAKLLLNDLLEVNHSPSVELLKSLSL